MSKMTSQLSQEFNYDTSVIWRHFIWRFSFGVRRDCPPTFLKYYPGGANVPTAVERDADTSSLSGSVSDIRGVPYATSPVINSGGVLYSHICWADNAGVGTSDVTFTVNKTGTYSYLSITAVSDGRDPLITLCLSQGCRLSQRTSLYWPTVARVQHRHFPRYLGTPSASLAHGTLGGGHQAQ